MPVFAVDPGSLEALHDIVVPPPISMWASTPGWYWMMALFAVVIGALAIWSGEIWKRNAYRRAALHELEQFESHSTTTSDSIRFIAELVKRVAMVTCSRSQIASLSGSEWLKFLDATLRANDFTQGPGRQLLEVYTPMAQPASAALIELVRHWITHHQAPSTC